MNTSTKWRALALMAWMACGVWRLSESAANAAPIILRLTPPSHLADPQFPDMACLSRFVPGQRFDLQATIKPDKGQIIQAVQFFLNGQPAPGPVSIVSTGLSGKLPTNCVVATLRAFSSDHPGVYQLSVLARQIDGQTATTNGSLEIVKLESVSPPAKNIIIMVGDGMGLAHRTALRIMLRGIARGKARAPLAMDRLPFTALVATPSLNSMVTDSAAGASAFTTGNKADNNQLGVFPDDTSKDFDNPRIENLAEYLHRVQGKSLGLVTTADVCDATPAAFGAHTQNRGAGTGIADQYLDDAQNTGLTVLLGGGLQWFLPKSEARSKRSRSTDYTLPAELASRWDLAPGAVDPDRNLVAGYQKAGFLFASNQVSLEALPADASPLLGLFAFANLSASLDRINGRRGISTVVEDDGFPNQPMLPEMVEAALRVLPKNTNGFLLLVEGGLIDKQAHVMDTERWLFEMIEFDQAVEKCRQFALQHPDTLLIVTADHETGGVGILGASRLKHEALKIRAASGGGIAQLRGGKSGQGSEAQTNTPAVVGTYEKAGFPRYSIAADGFPTTTDVDYRLLIGYAANADRYEDWLTNPLPIRSDKLPSGSTSTNHYPTNLLDRDAAGKFFIVGQVADTSAVHTASDIALSAFGCGAERFTGTLDNTDVFFKIIQASAITSP